MTAIGLTQVQARTGGFANDVSAIARRALRSVLRDPEAVIPGFIIPLFFFTVNTGALQNFVEAGGDLDYKAFQLPVAIIMAVTGPLSRALTLVEDVRSGYFDRLVMTPVRRLALLMGLMVADIALVIALSVPVLILGYAVGVRFETGVAGIAAFVALAAYWSLGYAGFSYAIALKTANAAAVSSSFMVFLPMMFLTPMFIPLEAMTGWMATVAQYNPVTYLLGSLRSIITVGWELDEILKGVLSVSVVVVLSLTMALLALKGRVSRH